MIVFDLSCRSGGHRFEGWFSSSEDFSRQQARGLVACPECGGSDVVKAPMAPAVPRKGNQIAERVAVPAAPTPAAPTPPAAPPMPPEVRAKLGQALMAIAQAQAEALKTSRWVGKRFAEDARAMHYGEVEAAPIHGQATAEEARDLIEEGVEIAPLLIPVAPPEALN